MSRRVFRRSFTLAAVATVAFTSGRVFERCQREAAAEGVSTRMKMSSLIQDKWDILVRHVQAKGHVALTTWEAWRSEARRALEGLRGPPPAKTDVHDEPDHQRAPEPPRIYDSASRRQLALGLAPLTKRLPAHVRDRLLGSRSSDE